MIFALPDFLPIWNLGSCVNYCASLWAFSGVSGSLDVHVEVEVSRKTVKFVGPLQVFFKSPWFGLFPLYTSFYLEKTDVFNWCLSGFSNMMYTFQCKPFYIPMVFFSLCHASSFWSQKMSGPPNTICQESFLFCVMYYVSPCAGQSLELTSRAITEGIGTIQFICPIVNRFIFAWVDLSSWLLGCLKLRYNLLK